MSGKMKRRGLLILNLGTPDSPEPEDVGRYLKQFLMDKWVIDIAAPFRWFLVNVLIVPKRKFASSEAYKTIWTDRGSPLAFHLEDLKSKVRSFGEAEFQVESAMRYQNPSIESALSKFVDVDEVVVFPLYPQYAESSTRSSKEEVERVAKSMGLSAELIFVQDYFDQPGFVSAFVSRIEAAAPKKPFHLLMSFHSLPESHVQKTDPSGEHCLKKQNCCDQITDVNRRCYRAQCFATARAIAARLGLGKDRWSVSFQSRLGRAEWLKPTTEASLPALGKSGVDLVVATPSFTADCLETIEEIGDRGKELFISNGGASFSRAECLNSGDDWARTVIEIARHTRTIHK
ncbi:MAG: ferrochelatase [Bdellovibrionota bacterium]